MTKLCAARGHCWIFNGMSTILRAAAGAERVMMFIAIATLVAALIGCALMLPSAIVARRQFARERKEGNKRRSRKLDVHISVRFRFRLGWQCSSPITALGIVSKSRCIGDGREDNRGI
jgi:hypothetical protein